MNKYLFEVQNKINEIEKSEIHSIENASEIIKETTINGGLVYVFGSGHSSILATEIFYRPGGLLNVYPIFHPPLMVHEGPMQSSILERDSKILNDFMNKYEITSKDCIIIVSTSGINPVPIDIAKMFKDKNAKVIALSSKHYYQKIDPRHTSGKFLIDFADVVLDNHIEKGDVVLKKDIYQFGSLSTIIGCCLVNWLTSKSIEKIIDKTGKVDIIFSGNMPGGLEHNKELVKKYSTKIKCLK